MLLVLVLEAVQWHRALGPGRVLVLLLIVMLLMLIEPWRLLLLWMCMVVQMLGGLGRLRLHLLRLHRSRAWRGIGRCGVRR